MRVLLFGDSITGYMPKELLNTDWYYNLKENNLDDGSLKYYKCAFENHTTEMLKQNIYPKINLKPYDIIVLQCGINDFLRPTYDEDCKKLSPQEIVNGIISFIEEIQKTSKAKLVLQSLYPININRSSLPNIVDDIKYVNKHLIMYCIENNIKFINMYNVLADNNGRLDIKYSQDGIHPNLQGYKIVANKLNSVLNHLENIQGL